MLTEIEKLRRKLTREDEALLEAAIKQGYLVCGRNCTSALYKFWFHHCKTTGQPFMVVEPRRGRCCIIDINLAIPPNQEVTKDAWNHFAEVAKNFLSNGKRCRCFWGWRHTRSLTIKGVPNSRIAEVAKILLPEAAKARQNLEIGKCSPTESPVYWRADSG